MVLQQFYQVLGFIANRYPSSFIRYQCLYRCNGYQNILAEVWRTSTAAMVGSHEWLSAAAAQDSLLKF